MTSSLTTATMRSSSCTAAWAGSRVDTAISSASSQCGRRHSGCLNNFIARPVSGNTVFQNVERVRADTPHSVQFELDEECIGGLVFLGGKTLHHPAQRPAAAIVFKSRQAFDQFAVLEGVVVAEHAVPASGECPLGGQVDLLRGLVDEAITQIHHAAGRGPIGGAEAFTDGGAVLGVELPRGIDAPGAGDLARGEVTAVSEGGLQPLESAGRLGEPAGDREGQLVGVVDAGAAGELV